MRSIAARIGSLTSETDGLKQFRSGRSKRLPFGEEVQLFEDIQRVVDVLCGSGDVHERLDEGLAVLLLEAYRS